MLLAGSVAYLLIVGTFISSQIKTKRQNIAPLWGVPKVAAEMFHSAGESFTSVGWVLGAGPAACDALLAPIVAPLCHWVGTAGAMGRFPSALQGHRGERANLRSASGYVEAKTWERRWGETRRRYGRKDRSTEWSLGGPVPCSCPRLRARWR